MKDKHIIIYTFQSLEDPLVKGLILEYLKTYKPTGHALRFHLITHEQNEFKLNGEQSNSIIAELNRYNIKWYPVKYRSGTFILFKKALNFIQTFIIAFKIKRQFRPVAIMGFLAIAGGYSYILSKLLRLRLIVYCFEPHSEYMVDFKIWKKSSLKYKLLKKFERLQVKNADYLVVPNNETKLLAEKIRPSENIYVCPICINTDTIVFDALSREKIRSFLNVKDKTILIYTGKFGGIYYTSDEVISFFSKLYKENTSFFFYVITPNVSEIDKSVTKFKLPPDSIHVSNTVKYEELNRHISAADIGFVALPTLPSQKYRTPVKTAIYLSCGLPYIVNKGIGEDDFIASNENVGIVIDNLDDSAITVVNQINDLLSRDKVGLYERCRKEAVSTRGLSSTGAVLEKIFSQL